MTDAALTEQEVYFLTYNDNAFGHAEEAVASDLFTRGFCEIEVREVYDHVTRTNHPKTFAKRTAKASAALYGDARLDTYDWREVFKYADAEHTRPVQGSICPPTPFRREDIKQVFDLSEGANDSLNWLVCGELKDGRIFYTEAGCDYTGWGCQEWGTSWVSWDFEELRSFGLTDDARARLTKLIEVDDYAWGRVDERVGRPCVVRNDNTDAWFAHGVVPPHLINRSMYGVGSIFGEGRIYDLGHAATRDGAIEAAHAADKWGQLPFVARLVESQESRDGRESLREHIQNNETGLSMEMVDVARRLDPLTAGRFRVSIQAASGYHCSPRLTSDDLTIYVEWEVLVLRNGAVGLALPPDLAEYVGDGHEPVGRMPSPAVQRLLDYLTSLGGEGP